MAITSESGKAWTARVPKVWRKVVEDDVIVRLSVVALFAERTEAGAFERAVEAFANGVLMERLVEPEGDDEVLGPGAVVATAEPVQDDGAWSVMGTLRTRWDFGAPWAART